MSNVAALRGKLKLTQRQLADRVGVTETTVRNWENNRSGVEWFQRVAMLCNALECSPEDLYRMEKVGDEATADQGDRPSEPKAKGKKAK